MNSSLLQKQTPANFLSVVRKIVAGTMLLCIVGLPTVSSAEHATPAPSALDEYCIERIESGEDPGPCDAYLEAIGLQGDSVAPRTDESREHIRLFGAEITVNTDRSIDVEETIVYWFPSNRHGIYRTIPIAYKSSFGGKTYRDLEDISVTDEDGNAYQYSTYRTGDERNIKIGDPDATITGEHTYVISYSVPSSIGFFDTFDEIYWNVTGNEWNVPIDSAYANIRLPETVDASLLKTSCYRGYAGDDEACAAGIVAEDGAIVFSGESFPMRHGMTVAVGFPKGLVVAPTDAEAAAQKLKDLLVGGWWIFLLPIVVFIKMFSKWYRKGRDPKGGTVIAQYDAPEGLSPMQVRLLLKQDFGNSIAAEIIYLAERGYLKVVASSDTSNPKDFDLIKLKDADDALQEHQSLLLEGLFEKGESLEALTALITKSEAGAALGGFLAGKVTNFLKDRAARGSESKVSLSDLKYSFYTTERKVDQLAEKALLAKALFEPEDTKKGKFVTPRMNSRKGTYIFLAVFASIFGSVFGSIFTTIIFGETTAVKFVPAYILSVIIVALFKYLMPRVTPAGAAAKAHIKGLALYLSVAEKDRIAFHNAPERNPQTFEKLLPFAMALGLEKKWAEAFAGIQLTPPNWYEGSSVSSFSATSFASTMSSFSSVSSRSLSSSPSSSSSSSSGSSGGGSSGGGGGGGGGGSW